MDSTSETRPGSVGASAAILRLVDPHEQYGRHVVEAMLARIPTCETACDLGVGLGFDLALVKQRFPAARLTGIDCSGAEAARLARDGIAVQVLDLERDALPFADESVDLFVANQVLEHVKELFWICHQMSLKLRVGGHVILGVPNISALHNRLLFLLGKQPTQMKSYSAHVRGFAAGEIPRFFAVCFPGGYRLEMFRGAQFYPFPTAVARPLARLFPALAHSTFYLLRKVSPYHGEFLRHPVEARLETPFHLGGPR